MKKKKILFIEDETYRNEALFEMLNFDYEINWATSPRDAINFIENSSNYDAIILDVILPVDDCFTEEEVILCNNGSNTGLVLANKLSKNIKSAEVPIILASARKYFDVSNYPNVKTSIIKPFYYQELKNEIENITNTK